MCAKTFDSKVLRHLVPWSMFKLNCNSTWACNYQPSTNTHTHTYKTSKLTKFCIVITIAFNCFAHTNTNETNTPKKTTKKKQTISASGRLYIFNVHTHTLKTKLPVSNWNHCQSFVLLFQVDIFQLQLTVPHLTCGYHCPLSNNREFTVMPLQQK